MDSAQAGAAPGMDGAAGPRLGVALMEPVEMVGVEIKSAGTKPHAVLLMDTVDIHRRTAMELQAVGFSLKVK